MSVAPALSCDASGAAPRAKALPGLAVHDKWSGELLAELEVPSPADLAETVERAARASAVDWPAHERARALQDARAAIISRREQFLTTLRRETGFTLRDVQVEFDRAMVTLELCSQEATRIAGEGVSLDSSPGLSGRTAFTIRVPVGVVLAITPFNAPLNTPCHKIGPALAAGNAVIVKPAELTPLSCVLLAEALWEAGVPRDRLQVVNGPGEQVGPTLLTHPAVGFTTFTGSTEVGRIVKQSTGVRPCALELGSISPTIVCADADLEGAAQAIVLGGFRKAGQVCTSVQRVFADRAIVAPLTELLADRVGALVAGDPADAAHDLGPLIGEPQARRVEALIEATLQAGARAPVRGRREGALLTPTLLDGVEDKMPTATTEAFGPLVAISSFARLEEAVERINAGRYGLQGGVFTTSLADALTVARRLQVGGVIVNGTSSTRADAMPFGGQKDSGFGREGPAHAVREMSVERLVVLG